MVGHHKVRQTIIYNGEKFVPHCQNANIGEQITTKENIGPRYRYLRNLLDKKQKRLYVATEALAYGRGGVTIATTAYGLSRMTVTSGGKELLKSEGIEI